MDLSALVALKAQLEGEEGSPTTDAELAVLDSSEGEVSEDKKQDLLTEVVTALLPHTKIAPEEFSLSTEISTLRLNKLAIWAVVARLESEFKLSIPDIEVEKWRNIADIVATLESISEKP
ncbi:hypothetical protein KRX54_06150 [Actinomycetaceae bacterium TAE3-ERU4]|nr:hypothetical protein [Actinomycetaceae bacterium TAE3-ERU4]